MNQKLKLGDNNHTFSLKKISLQVKTTSFWHDPIFSLQRMETSIIIPKWFLSHFRNGDGAKKNEKACYFFEKSLVIMWRDVFYLWMMCQRRFYGRVKRCDIFYYYFVGVVHWSEGKGK